jgi:hypothetical protein
MYRMDRRQGQGEIADRSVAYNCYIVQCYGLRRLGLATLAFFT